MPAAVAVSVVITDVPPIFSVPVAPLINVPAPDSAVPTVRMPLLVYMPVTATLPIEVVVAPLKVWPAPLKVYTAVVTLKEVALFVKLPLMAYEVVSVSFHAAPLLSITLPANTFACAPDKVIVPVIFAFPFTVKTPEQVSVPPLMMVREPIVKLMPVAVSVPPLLIVTDPICVMIAPTLTATLIATSSAAVGTTPPAHVPGVAQSPAVLATSGLKTATFNKPLVAAK